MLTQLDMDIEAVRRCKAKNAIRLACLGPDIYKYAAKTFGLQPVDIKTAEAMLDQWMAGDGHGATESEKVAYLLSKGWKRNKCDALRTVRRPVAMGDIYGPNTRRSIVA